MTHDGFGGGTKEDPSQTCTSMRRNHYQINVTLFRNPDNLRSCLAMHDEFFHIKPGTVFTFGELWEFALG